MGITMRAFESSITPSIVSSIITEEAVEMLELTELVFEERLFARADPLDSDAGGVISNRCVSRVL